MTRLRALWIAATLGAGLVLAAGSAVAETPAGLPRYAGQYVYSNTREHGIAIVEKASEAALAELNMVMRLLAKKAMADRFAFNILIEVPAGKVGMKVGTLDKVTAELNKPTKVTSQDGKQTGMVTYKFEGGKLLTSLTGDDGSITSTFTLSTDGKTLQRDVNVVSKRMKKPVSYRLIYKRK
jgi:hypothetical protein